MEFFTVEINFEKAGIDVPAEPGYERLSLPGATFCWNASSPLVDVSRQADWTVFLWGSARSKAGEDPVHHQAWEIAQTLAQGGSLHSYLANLEGGFGVIAWNEKEPRLLFATDPIGMTKLYYGENDGRFVISSHAQLAAKKLGSLAPSGEGLSLLFSLKGIPAPHTVFQSVSVLKPAELVSLTKSSKQSQTYWSILESFKPFEGSIEDAQAELRALLDKSLQRIHNAESDTLGLALSGGVDSAIIAALLVQAGIPAQGLTVGYNPTTRHDESRDASENAAQIGLPLDVLKVTDQDIAGILDFAAQCLPEPLGDATVLPQLLMTLAGRGTLTSIIDGTGADNIFGGMQKFTAERYAKQYLKIPRFLRKGVIRPLADLLPSSRKDSFTDKVRKFQKFSYGVELPGDLQKVYWSRFMTREAVEGLLKPALSPNGQLSDQILLDIRGEVPSTYDDFFISTYASVRGTMPTHATQKLSALQYASGTRYHMPFMTPTLIEFALSLPESYKLKDNQTKIVLRRMAAQIMPAECLTRRKATFSPPIGRWLMGVLKTEFTDLLKGNSFFNEVAVEKMMAEHTSGMRDWQWELWLVFICLKWYGEALR